MRQQDPKIMPDFVAAGTRRSFRWFGLRWWLSLLARLIIVFAAIGAASVSAAGSSAIDSYSIVATLSPVAAIALAVLLGAALTTKSMPNVHPALAPTLDIAAVVLALTAIATNYLWIVNLPSFDTLPIQLQSPPFGTLRFELGPAS